MRVKNGAKIFKLHTCNFANSASVNFHFEMSPLGAVYSKLLKY